MLINGCLTKCDDVDEDIVKEMFVDLDYSDNIEDESLAAISGDFTFYVIECDDTDFTIVSDKEEYRCIHENDVEDVFRNEATDYYGVDEWKEAVEGDATTLGYDEWFDEIIDQSDYGSIFAHYDGDYTNIGDYYVFRVN